MLLNTRVFILKKTAYGDTSIIVNAFLEDRGYTSFIVQGARKPKAKLNAVLFEVGNILDLVYYHKSNAELYKIKEARLFLIPQNTVSSMYKKAQVIFIADFVYKTMRSEPGNAMLFELILSKVNEIENTENPESALHFVVQCMNYFGIYDEMIFGHKLLRKTEQQELICSNGTERKVLMDKMLHFFVEHHFDEKLMQMQSVEILKMVF